MALLSVPPWPDPGPSATAAATHHRARAVQLPRHGIDDCWGLQCFGCLVAASAPCRAMETPPLGPTLLYRCNNVLFFLTLRGNFGADSNNFGPCPSHAFRLSELQSLTDLLLYPVVVWANRGGFDSYNEEQLSNASPPFHGAATPLQKRLAALQLVVHFSFRRLSRVSGVNPSLGPGLPVPESESLNQAESSVPQRPAESESSWHGMPVPRPNLNLNLTEPRSPVLRTPRPSGRA